MPMKPALNPWMQIREFLGATRVILIKDLQVWLRQPVTLAATFAPSLVFLLVQALGAERPATKCPTLTG